MVYGFNVCFYALYTQYIGLAEIKEALSHLMLCAPVFIFTVELVLSGHPLEIAKCPFNTGCPLNAGPLKMNFGCG